MEHPGKRWRRFLALAFVAAGIALVLWRVDSELRRENWYLKRPTSWWAAQLDNYRRPSGSDLDFVSFDHIQRPPTPSPPPSVFDKCAYLLSRRLGRPATADPKLWAIIDPGVDSLPVLMDLLHDPKPRVRVWAAFFLMGSEESITGISQKELMEIIKNAALEKRDNEADRLGQVRR
jgi:hypothetical protein